MTLGGLEISGFRSNGLVAGCLSDVIIRPLSQYLGQVGQGIPTFGLVPGISGMTLTFIMPILEGWTMG